MSSKNAVATKDNTMSLEGATSLVNSVKEGLKLVSQGYLAITPDVAKLYDCKGFKSLGYKNFDELCAMEFGMSHGTTVGIRKVFDKFGSVSKENKYTIPEKYLEFGYTKLLLFTDKKFETAGINPTEVFTPEMTMAEMKSVLAEALETKAEKQDSEAIETTATEVENVSRETSGETSAEVPTTAGLTDVELIDSIITDTDQLRPMIDGKIDKAKLALIDAIIANLKELKAEVKKADKKAGK